MPMHHSPDKLYGHSLVAYALIPVSVNAEVSQPRQIVWAQPSYRLH